jgi:signal transduction histidine kinase
MAHISERGARLSRAHELARATLADVRHSVWALAEPLVDGAALPQELAALATACAERSGLAAHYWHEGGPIILRGEAATHVLRIVQEALHNVEKHAAARHVEIGSCVAAGELRLWVQDDGVGFDPLQHERDTLGGGFGLIGLHERARLADGTLHITSAPGAGTRVELRLQHSGFRIQNSEDE